MPHKLYLKIFPPNSATLSNRELAVRVCVAYFGMNGIGFALGQLWTLDRPVFNLDYLLVGLVYLWVSRSLAAVLAAGLFGLDVITMIIPVFFFSRESFSVLFWLRSVQQWSFSVIATALLGTVFVLLIIIGVFRRYRLSLTNRLTTTVWLVGLTGLLLAADWLNGSSTFLGSQASHFDVNLAGSPVRYICQITWKSLKGKAAEFTPIPPSATATGRYFSDLLATSPTRGELEKGMACLPSAAGQGRLPEKLVVVVVESLSVLQADENLKGWRQPFNRLGDRYTIQSGILDWHGATFRGEVRELCWQSLDGYQVQSLPAALPAVLKGLQYETCSFHGFHAGMYQRDRLYPQLGFARRVFLDDMEKDSAQPVPIAGTLFHGATDSFVTSLVRNEVLRPGKRLVYWMTLSGHIPVNTPLARDLTTPEDQKTSGELPVEVWAHTVICRNVLQNIADIAAEKSLRDCDFVIVGDHSVPFTSAKLRNYYRPNCVPYLILRHIEPVPDSRMAAGATP